MTYLVQTHIVTKPLLSVKGDVISPNTQGSKGQTYYGKHPGVVSNPFENNLNPNGTHLGKGKLFKIHFPLFLFHQ